MKSKIFNVAVVPDCQDTKQYIPNDIKLTFQYWFKANMSNQVPNQVIETYKDSEFFWRPRGCFFSQCQLVKSGDTEPFAVLKDSTDKQDPDTVNRYDQYLDLIVDTSKTQKSDEFKIVCTVHKGGKVESKPFPMEIKVNCSNLDIYGQSDS